MAQIDWSKNPEMIGTDYNFSCINCACNHSHIAKYEGIIVRVCYDCGEILEDKPSINPIERLKLRIESIREMVQSANYQSPSFVDPTFKEIFNQLNKLEEDLDK